MARTKFQKLIDRGRKAGLGTTELYNAMRSRRPEVGDQLDGNGFVSGYGRDGQRIYRPADRKVS